MEIGISPETLTAEMEKRGVLGNTMDVLPLTVEDSMEIARLRLLTRPFGLSLGDRACLALGKRIKIPAASCGVFPQPQFARFRCKQRGIRP
jgi:PIN domain nuclease of toxin-antitoxin system